VLSQDLTHPALRAPLRGGDFHAIDSIPQPIFSHHPPRQFDPHLQNQKSGRNLDSDTDPLQTD
jgi:hypothetical protein